MVIGMRDNPFNIKTEEVYLTINMLSGVNLLMNLKKNMRAKKGYRKQKSDWSMGNWLKRYFEKRTCKKFTKKMADNMKDSLPEYSKTVDDNFWDLVDKEK